MPFIAINVQVGDVFHIDRRRTIRNVNSNNVISTITTLSRGKLIANINPQVERKTDKKKSETQRTPPENVSVPNTDVDPGTLSKPMKL